MHAHLVAHFLNTGEILVHFDDGGEAVARVVVVGHIFTFKDFEGTEFGLLTGDGALVGDEGFNGLTVKRHGLQGFDVLHAVGNGHVEHVLRELHEVGVVGDEVGLAVHHDDGGVLVVISGL